MSKITIKNTISYIQGNIRYQAYYSKRFNWLIRKHIREQIEFRINSMNKECYNKGSCIMCGCKTTALQMANKSCDNPCYPKMVIKEVWEYWKEKCKDKKSNCRITGNWVLDLNNRKFKRKII